MRKRHSLILVFAALFALGACATDTVSDQAARLTFDDVQPLAVNVAAVNIVNNYVPGADGSDISSVFVARPDMALRQYAEKRLQAVGSSGLLQLTIQTASVHHHTEAPDNRVGKWMNYGGTDVYEADLVFSLGISPTGNMLTGPSSTLTVHRAITIPDNLSIADREQEEVRMLKMMLADADKAMQDILRNKLGVLYQGTMPPRVAAPVAPATAEPLTPPPVNSGGDDMMQAPLTAP